MRSPFDVLTHPSRATRNGIAMLLLALLTGCGGAGGIRPPAAPHHPPASDAAHSTHLANAVLMRAIGLVGTPYRYGGNTPAGGFDCSGLVGFVFDDAAGLRLPRTAAEIARAPGRPVSGDQLGAGDLVLFGAGGRIEHIGIYVGEQRFVHAPSSGGTVRLDPLDRGYWQRRFVGGRRLLH